MSEETLSESEQIALMKKILLERFLETNKRSASRTSDSYFFKATALGELAQGYAALVEAEKTLRRAGTAVTLKPRL